MTFSTVAILGPGLLGGSLALAIRERMAGTRICIWARREESVQRVLALGLADAASTDAAAMAKGAGLVLFCMPIGGMPEVARQISDVVSVDTIVTDVGSVKQPVVERLGAIFTGRAEFLGSHPMAGSDQAGLDAARGDLFDGAVTILTPGEGTKKETVERLANFWEGVGCRVVVADARAHDEAVALISHLPHLAAAALVQTALRENPAALDWRGAGFMDTTRVASGPPGMWAEILLENRVALKKAIHAMIENLSEVSKLLDADEAAAVEHYLAEAGQARERLKRKSQKSIS
jgi:prephenate dehydrogenase